MFLLFNYSCTENYVCSQILSFSQANKLTRHSLIDAGRRSEALGLETKEWIVIQQLASTAACPDFSSTLSAMAAVSSGFLGALAHSMNLSAKVRYPQSFVMAWKKTAPHLPFALKQTSS